MIGQSSSLVLLSIRLYSLSLSDKLTCFDSAGSKEPKSYSPLSRSWPADSKFLGGFPVLLWSISSDCCEACILVLLSFLSFYSLFLVFLIFFLCPFLFIIYSSSFWQSIHKVSDDHSSGFGVQPQWLQVFIYYLI